MIGPLLDGTAELGAGQHWDVQIARKPFERARYLPHLLHAVVASAAATANELEIVYDKKVQSSLKGLACRFS